MPTDIRAKSTPRRGTPALDVALVAATRCLIGVSIALAALMLIELLARQAGTAGADIPLELQGAVMALS